MMREREEFGEKARQIVLELEELGGEHPERAEQLQAELREVLLKIEQIERELDSPRRQEVVRGVRRVRVDHDRERDRMMPRREREEQVHKLERLLEELGDKHPEQTEQIRDLLDQIREQVQRIEPDRFDRRWSRPEEPMRPRPNIERRPGEPMIRQEHLQSQIREKELVLGELNEQGKGDSEEAHILGQELRALVEQLEAAQREFRGARPDRPQPRERDELEREVHELRRQVDGVNEQMAELRELLKRLLEEGGQPELR
jgi:hypothetical protein